MTFKEELAKPDPRTPDGDNGFSHSKRGLFASRKEQGDDPFSTPDVPRFKREGLGIFPGGSRSPAPLTPSSDGLLRLDALKLMPLKSNLNIFLTPSRTFNRLRDEREELSRQTPSPGGRCIKDSIKLPLIGEVSYAHLKVVAIQWLRNPKNLALLFWGLAVGVSGALLFMVMTGMLNAVIPGKGDRDVWFEVNNQILNALFTLMCVYLHPQRCHQLCLLYRWKPEDIVKMREVYCKNGTRKPHEWGHMLICVLLLQLNCFAQYALCGLNWGFRRAERPPIGVAVCLSLSLGGAAGAGIYNIISPLGRDFQLEDDEPMQDYLEKGETNSNHREFAARTRVYNLLERRMSFALRNSEALVEKAEWKGGVLDCGMDKPVACISTFCCVCAFGWNMDRLGFGNRYVHVVTFILLCTAPFWIFDLAAVNIQDRVVRHALSGAGIALCALGLLYGGYWRIRMRQRFKLPANHCCCRQANITDCFQWLFCPLCSLCQEVRTAESYEVRDDQFYTRGHREEDSPGSTPPFTASPGPLGPASLAPSLSAIPELSNSLSKEESVSKSNSVVSQEVELVVPDGNMEHMNKMVPPEPLTAMRDSSTTVA